MTETNDQKGEGAACEHPEYYDDHVAGQWKELFCASCGAELKNSQLTGRKNLGERQD